APRKRPLPARRRRGRRGLRALAAWLAGERAAADEPVDVVGDSLTELAVGCDDPEWRRQLAHVPRDPVVGALGAFPDDDHVVTMAAAPVARELLQFGLADVRPHRAAHVLAVDEDGRQATRSRASSSTRAAPRRRRPRRP